MTHDRLYVVEYFVEVSGNLYRCEEKFRSMEKAREFAEQKFSQEKHIAKIHCYWHESTQIYDGEWRVPYATE